MRRIRASFARAHSRAQASDDYAWVVEHFSESAIDPSPIGKNIGNLEQSRVKEKQAVTKLLILRIITAIRSALRFREREGWAVV